MNEDLTRPIESEQEALFGDVEEPGATQPRRTRKEAGHMPLQQQGAPEVDLLSQIAVERIAPTPAAAPAESVANALFVGAFVRELLRCGVCEFVVSPGSRSTPLAMVAAELAGEVHVHVDERGAAFYALGLAKATGNPVAVICTSGTAPGNWLPAVLEAEASRVPLLLLSADRPPALQNVAAHQTTNQLGLFGDHVKKFYQTPLPTQREEDAAYARQVALDACIAAHGAMPGALSCDGGPVHINFPFEEPLKPARASSVAHVLDQLPAFCAEAGLPPSVVPGQLLYPRDAAGLAQVFAGKRTLVLCGEGTCNSPEDVQVMAAFAEKLQTPLLADPLSGMRCSESAYIIDNYDTVFGTGDAPLPEVIVRFGRWPVSKRATAALGGCSAVQLVVDMRDTRDSQRATTLLVRTTPVAFAQAMCDAESPASADEAFAQRWIELNDEASWRIAQVAQLPNMDRFEGAYVDRLLSSIPENSLLFSASSMSIRAVDTFYRKSAKNITVLCNRGLSGIDGTLSCAIGAAQAFTQATVLTGDLAFLHDVGGLALQNEMLLREKRGAGLAPSVIVVVLNNNGGGIFDMLPQKSDEDYFQRLFLTPQQFSVKMAAEAFGIEYRRAETVADFGRLYSMLLGNPGLHIVDIPLPLAGLKNRYERFW